jgi:hypothetical protein
MPYFYKKSYISEKCYDSYINDYTSDKYKPLSSKRFLNELQILAVANFIKENLQGKKFNKNYCESFFKKKSKVCEKL